MMRMVLVGDDQVVARLQGMPVKVRRALSDALRRQWIGLQAYIVRSKLSGQVLNRVTGNLASSINAGGADSATEFTDLPGEIIGRVGTRVWYGKLHEYGGTVDIKSHTRTQSQAWGKPINPVQVTVRAYQATYPERSFLRSGLNDRASQIRSAIAAAITQAVGT